MRYVVPHQSNPYYARTSLVGRGNTSRPVPLAGFLGDDPVLDSGGPVDLTSIDTTPNVAISDTSAPAVQDDFFNATAAQESSPTAVQSLFASAAGTPAAAPDPTQSVFDAATAAQDGTTGQAATTPTPTPAAPSSSAGSTDWSKAISAALSAGGAATAAVITGRTNKDIAAMANQPGASTGAAGALARAKNNLTSAFASVLGKTPSWLPWAIGGGTIVLIGLLAIKRHAKKPPP